MTRNKKDPQFESDFLISLNAIIKYVQHMHIYTYTHIKISTTDVGRKNSSQNPHIFQILFFLIVLYHN